MANDSPSPVAESPAAATAGAPHPAVPRIRRDRRGPWLQILSEAGFERSSVTLPIAGLPPALAGLRIVHLSDLHFRARWTLGHDQLVADLQRDPPDLLLFTGDFVESKTDHVPALPFVKRFIEGVRTREGFFAILGNHDGPLLEGRLAGEAAQFIGGQRVVVSTARGEIELIGMPGHKRSHATPQFIESQPPRRPGVPRIVMGHFPDLIERIGALDADLYLCGHTHGGQFCLPGRIPIIRHDSLPRAMSSGLHRVGRTWMLVNRGFGFSGIAMRAFCPNEIIRITLERA